MLSVEIFSKIKNIIKQLKQLETTTTIIGPVEEKALEVGKKEASLLQKLVNYFDEILSDKYIIPKEEKKENHNFYWDYISKHFNTPIVNFCRNFDKVESNKNAEARKYKRKDWIYFSILENSFYDSINEIYLQKWDEKYYEQDSIFRKNKIEICNILADLQQIQFIYINSKDYEKYKDFLKNFQYTQNRSNTNTSFEIPSFPKDLQIIQSPIITKKNLTLKMQPNDSQKLKMFINEDFSFLSYQSEFFGPDEKEYTFLGEDYLLAEQIKAEEENEKKYNFSKKADFFPSITDDFYTFVPRETKNIKREKNEEENNINEDDSNSIHNEEEQKFDNDLILNPQTSSYLPTDKLYGITEKQSNEFNNYNNSNKLIYKKKEIPISNCLLLYLNNFYKKAEYHQFYKHNLNNRPITLKEQNYQCYICHKKIPVFFNFPIGNIFWCSYYMRYVCNDCIDEEYSIIPYFVLKKWCFEKFSISKKAKKLLLAWYTKPIIYFKKNDILIKKIYQLNKVIEIKKIINNIFNIMKCKNKFKIIEEILGEYNYLALKECIFSMKDLVEINNHTFIKKINQFKNKFIQHISGECPKCKFDGETCFICGKGELIFFYNIESVFYCNICKKSFHKKCIGIVGHIH